MVCGLFSYTLLLTSQNTNCLHLCFIVYFPTIPRKLPSGRNLANVRAEVASWTETLLSLYCILGNQNAAKGSQQFFQLLQWMHSISQWHSHQPFPPYNFMSSEVKSGVCHLKHANVQRTRYSAIHSSPLWNWVKSCLMLISVCNCSWKDHEKKDNFSKVDFRGCATK